MENKIDAHTLSVLQQVLRTLTLSLATASKADLHTLASLLTSGAANPQLAPEATLMLKDLGDGMGAIAEQLQPKPASPRH